MTLPRGGARERSGLRWFMGLALGIALLGVPGAPCLSAQAQSAPVSEYQLKAVFLYNFAQFVDWPPAAFADSAAPMVIGVLGQDNFGSSLDETVRGEKVDNHPLVVERYHQLDEIKNCQILFISQSENERLPQIVEALQGRPILTVSDVPNFAARGGIIQFVTKDSKIRLDINVDAAKAATLTISSKLLRPATIVKSEKH